MLDAGLRIEEKFSPQEAVSIVMAILYLRKRLPQLIELYHKMMVIINRDVFALSFNNINNIVRQSLEKFIHWDTAYYDHDLMKHAVDYVIKKNVDLKEIGFLLRSFNRVVSWTFRNISYIQIFSTDDGDTRATRNAV